MLTNGSRDAVTLHGMTEISYGPQCTHPNYAFVRWPYVVGRWWRAMVYFVDAMRTVLQVLVGTLGEITQHEHSKAVSTRGSVAPRFRRIVHRCRSRPLPLDASTESEQSRRQSLLPRESPRYAQKHCLYAAHRAGDRVTIGAGLSKFYHDDASGFSEYLLTRPT